MYDTVMQHRRAKDDVKRLLANDASIIDTVSSALDMIQFIAKSRDDKIAYMIASTVINVIDDDRHVNDRRIEEVVDTKHDRNDNDQIDIEEDDEIDNQSENQVNSNKDENDAADDHSDDENQKDEQQQWLTDSDQLEGSDCEEEEAEEEVEEMVQTKHTKIAVHGSNEDKP